MGGHGVSAQIGKSAPTRRTGEDRTRTVMKMNGGGHTNSQVSRTSGAVVEVSTGNSLEWVVVAG